MTEASALVDLDRAADGGNPGTGTDADAVSKAKVLMRTALAGKLEEAGAPWQFCDVEVPVVGKLHTASVAFGKNAGPEPGSRSYHVSARWQSLTGSRSRSRSASSGSGSHLSQAHHALNQIRRSTGIAIK